MQVFDWCKQIQTKWKNPFKNRILLHLSHIISWIVSRARNSYSILSRSVTRIYTKHNLSLGSSVAPLFL